MSDLYGAPSGIIASERNIRENVNAGLLAQKTLGEIEQQPADLALKQAHARLYGAEAADKEATAAMNQQSLKLQSDFAAERQARMQLAGQLPATAGRDATVGDLPPNGKLVRKSQADTLVQYADFLEKRGAPVSMTTPIRKEIAGIQEKEAIGHYRDSQATNEDFKTLQAKLKSIGGTAAAAAESPQNYMSILGNPQQRQFLPPGLTGNYVTDKPILAAVARSSMDAHQQAELTAKAKEDASKQALRTAEVAQANQRISLMRARQDALTVAADNAIKYNGSKSKAAEDALKARTEAAKARVFSEQLKFAPMLKLDPSKVIVGNLYTLQDKSLVRITGKAANGDPIGEPVGKDEAKQLRVDALNADKSGEDSSPVNVE